MKFSTRTRPSPAMVVSVVALSFALAGSAVAGTDAITSALSKSKVKKIAIKQIDKKAPGLSVANAEALGGVPPDGYQGFCEAGAIKGSAVVNTNGLPTDGAYQNITGFNCTGGAVQVRKAGATGDYRVRFVNNPGTGTAVATFNSTYNGTLRVNRIADPAIGGEEVFQVVASEPPGTPANNTTFTLLAF